MKKEGLFQKLLNLATSKVGSESNTPIIREFSLKKDQEAILGWQEDLFTGNFPGFKMNPYFMREQKLRLNDAYMLPEHAIYVLEIKPGYLAGFIWCHIYDTNEYGAFGSIEAIYLIPEMRGKGFGRKLMERGEEFFINRGIKNIKLYVTITNEVAVNLYQNLGYEVKRWEMQKDISNNLND